MDIFNASEWNTFHLYIIYEHDMCLCVAILLVPMTIIIIIYHIMSLEGEGACCSAHNITNYMLCHLRVRVHAAMLIILLIIYYVT